MESGNILLLILQWAWLTLFVAVGELFRRLFSMDKKLAILELDLKHSKEQRVEMVDQMKRHSDALDAHNQSVVDAINRSGERLSAIEAKL